MVPLWLCIMRRGPHNSFPWGMDHVRTMHCGRAGAQFTQVPSRPTHWQSVGAPPGSDPTRRPGSLVEDGPRPAARRQASPREDLRSAPSHPDRTGTHRHGPDRHHVVDRREPEPAGGAPNAEVLRMPIGRARHAEQELRPQQRPKVGVRLGRLLEHRPICRRLSPGRCAAWPICSTRSTTAWTVLSRSTSRIVMVVVAVGWPIAAPRIPQT